MPENSITDSEVTELLRQTEEAASAYIRGDMDRYLELTHHADGYTLMQPTGGGPVRYENRADTVKSNTGFFTGGESRLEQVETHFWGDTLVVGMVERQHGQVGGLPDQDWSLRVTQVFRHDGAGWLLVHRHADPLVKPIGFEQMAALADS
jgi:ketosteroid isomerase-like protein